MILCDWCHETKDVLRGVQFEVTPCKGETEAILLGFDLCGQCRRDAAKVIREAILELQKEKKKARVPIPGD